MPVFRVEVFPTAPSDGAAMDLLHQIRELNVVGVAGVRVSSLYFFLGQLTQADIERLADELLVDPVTESVHWQMDSAEPQRSTTRVIEVSLLPGVTDPIAWHLLRRTHLLGLTQVERVATATRYVLSGDLTDQALHTIAQNILCNQVIQTYALEALHPQFPPEPEPRTQVTIVPIRTLGEAELLRLSRERVLFLSRDELLAIRDHFAIIGREPTDVELETLAQTWSEHCQHKTFKAHIRYVCRSGMERLLPPGETAVQAPYAETIHGLLTSLLRDATERLAHPWVRSAFVDNAGIVDVDGEFEVSFKVETHNHPSALEPFGGANTGVGGVIRDVIGVSARPIANTDVLCFGPLDLPNDHVPAGVLHPRRIARGVVAGIEDYGNKMGIPTVAGAILYDKGYTANPLVFCGCVGLARHGQHVSDPQPGDLCVAIGGRTGRDGLHGATFSSAELTHDTSQTVGSVVQIGDPITEKAVLEAVMVLRDAGLYHAITDCGAGGFSSAVGEMGKDVGVDVDLSTAPLKYPGLLPWEIWVSEAQERMVLAVPEANIGRLGEICDGLDVEWTVLGRFTGDGRLRVRHGEQVVADLDMQFVHEGWPRPILNAEWSPPPVQEPQLPPVTECTSMLLRILAHPDVASKEAVIRRYDHEVQGATVVRPLTGLTHDGPSDGVALKPLVVNGSQGIVLGCGINPYYGLIDPYAMAWAVVDEAVRNVVSVGGAPDKIALLDNFCWGNPNLPDRLGALVRAVQGCRDAALAYGFPFVSGKDSMNNEYVDSDGLKRTIPPTLLISALGFIPDVTKAITTHLKDSGNLIYLVGETRPELGGSLFYRVQGELGATVPAPAPRAVETMRSLHATMRQDLVQSCHDLAEGGLAVAAAEMCIGGRLGMELSLAPLWHEELGRADTALFAESSGRFLVEVRSQDAKAFEAAMTGCYCRHLGAVSADGRLRIADVQGTLLVECQISALRDAWQSAAII